MDVEVRTALSEDQAGEVEALAREAAAKDGVAALGEDTLLKLRRPGGSHLVVRASGALAGYAHVDDAGSGELVVHPAHRRRGHGRALTGAALATDAARRAAELRIWAHGDLPEARALAGATGFAPVRTLLRLRRPLAGELPEPRLPDGVTLRAFAPGADDAEWLAVNARSFAHHPEQGRTTQEDLDARKREPWFDAEGFLVAERDGAMVGYHWTKIEDGEGEVYVVGVDPDAQAGGLGTALTLAGLRLMRDRGVPHATLYVEADNAPALKVYERLGFTRWTADVMFGRATGALPPNG